MEEKLQAGLPTTAMLVFAVVWTGIIAFAALHGVVAKASIAAFAQ